jgi:hypothetical protein
MRILNTINAEINFQQQHNNSKINAKRFLVKLDPGKTHKGKTSERGAFYYSEMRELMSFTAVKISANHTNISQECAQQSSSKTMTEMSRNSCPENRVVRPFIFVPPCCTYCTEFAQKFMPPPAVSISVSKLLYDILEICANTASEICSTASSIFVPFSAVWPLQNPYCMAQVLLYLLLDLCVVLLPW